jgi:dynein heavy chain
VVIVKSLANPPAGVKLVMEATCIMFEEKPKMVADPNRQGKKIPDYWDNSKRLLSDPSKFLTSLLEYDRDNIPQASPLPSQPSFTSPRSVHFLPSVPVQQSN